MTHTDIEDAGPGAGAACEPGSLTMRGEMP